MIKSNVVYATVDKLYCDNCGKEMDGPITFTFPTQHKYQCSCGFVEIHHKVYPSISYHDADGNSVI